MENLGFTRDLVLVLATAFLGGFLAKKLRQPLLTGYILGGVIVGGIASRFFSFNQNLSTLAEVGIAFLMFTLGLEFSRSGLRKIKKEIIFCAVVQILGVIILAILVLPSFGFNFYTSIFLGSCFSLSSTAVTIKILADRGELETLWGGVSVGWLLIQDLAVIPMIILLPVLAANLNGGNIGGVLLIFSLALLKTILLLFLVIFLGKRLVPWAGKQILKTHSRELLLLSVVSFCLILAFGTAALGLSPALGAFLAGFLISEVGISASIFGEVRPLRDIFAVIFFVTLGFLLEPQFLLSHLGQIILLASLIMLVKFLLVAFLTLYLGYHTKIAFLTAVSLTSVGEFAAVLGQTGVKADFISREVNFMVVSVVLLTLVLTPWTTGLAPMVYRRLKIAGQRFVYLAAFFNRFDRRPMAEELPLENHVVILGFGRVGKYIGRALEMAGIPFLVVDYNFQIIKSLKDKGLNAVYGDPAEINVLEYARADKARAVVLAIPDRQTQEIVIGNLQTISPQIKIICRTHHEEDQARLKALQVSTIIQPEFEAALSIVDKLLSEFGVERLEIEGKIKRLKIEHGMG